MFLFNFIVLKVILLFSKYFYFFLFSLKFSRHTLRLCSTPVEKYCLIRSIVHISVFVIKSSDYYKKKIRKNFLWENHLPTYYYHYFYLSFFACYIFSYISICFVISKWKDHLYYLLKNQLCYLDKKNQNISHSCYIESYAELEMINRMK